MFEPTPAATHAPTPTHAPASNSASARANRRPVFAAAAAAAVALAMCSTAGAQMILDVYGGSLTAYKPTAATAVQNIRPGHLSRGVNIDGSLRSASPLGWACAGNPFGDGAGWSGHDRLESVRLDTGTYNPTEADLALPSVGVRWVVGRTYNGRQTDGSALLVSNGYQGKNWMQTSQPEIVRAEGATDPDDVVYIVYGADRFLEFRRVDSTDVYKGKNGCAGVVKRTAGQAGTPNTPEKYEYFDQNGTVTTFFGDTYAAQAAFQVWKIEDTAGNKCYVGDGASMATAIASYDDGTEAYGAIKAAYDSAGRRYTYDYSQGTDGVWRLAQVKAELNTGSWVTVGQVDYTYCGNGDTSGPAGNLKQVKVTTPMTAGADHVRVQHYRYYSQAYNDSANRRGHQNGLKMVVEWEGVRRFDWNWGGDHSFDDDQLSAADDDLKPYAAAFLEYESSTATKRLSAAVFNGECGCAGGANGTYTFTYDESSGYAGYLDTSSGTGLSYDNGWGTRTVVAQPDGTYFTQYFDETGQPLSRVTTDGDPATGTPDTWVTEVLRAGATPGTGNATGCITEVRTPSANSGYTHSTGAITGSATAGLIHTFTRTDSGVLTGFVTDRFWKTDGHAYYDGGTTYTSQTFTGTTPGVVRPLVASKSEYYEKLEQNPTPPLTGFNKTTMTYAFHSATSSDAKFLAVLSAKTEYQAVTYNGPGASTPTSTTQWFTAYGAPTFALAADGIVSYREYDANTGLLVKSIEDADTATPDADIGVSVPSGAASNGLGSAEVHNKTTYTYDNQGRIKTVTTPSGRIATTEYKALDDRRMVTLSSPAKSGSTYYGPASYVITDHGGKAEAQGSIGFSSNSTTTAPSGWVTSSGDDYSCITTGAVIRLSTMIYNQAGNHLTESRLYTNFTGMSFPGASGTNYDATAFGYDGMGRKERVVDPTSTIDRTVFDALGRPVEHWTGTSDTGWPGSTGNMTKVGSTVYDSGNDGGNGYVTSRSQYPDGATGVRTTTYANDDRGRALLITNPEKPHVLNAYDNLGRTTATAQYSSTAGITPGTTDPAYHGTQSARMALSTTAYDEKGQVYQSKRYKIDQTDGSDDDSIATDSWYDATGRRIKVHGEELSKTFYDRLGRPTHRFVLAKAQKSGGADEDYFDADDVTDDIVLEEHQTVYENTTGNVLFTATIGRHANESSTHYGARDRNDDTDPLKLTAGDIVGRIQIAASWYDALDRLTSTVNYGSNLIVGDDAADASHDFTRPSTAPTGDSEKLRTDYSYPDTRTQLFSSGFYGTFQDVTDPAGKVTRTWLDDAGRKVVTIANPGGSAPANGNDRDDDIYTRYEYAHGLQTAMWVDLDGDGTKDSTDQVTRYIYGVTTGTGDKYSKLNSNRPLVAAVYPDSTNAGTTTAAIYTDASDVVSYAYNALGQEIYTKDQAGNTVLQEYDTAGRITARKPTAVTGFDNTVRRIAVAYVDRGMVDTVTQYDAATGGNVLDQVGYTYDGWGGLTKFEQDVDSTIGASGQAATSVQYTTAKSGSTSGRRTLRRSSATMPGGDAVDYQYGSDSTVSGSFSRVSSLKLGSGVVIASYAYTGASTVVRTDLDEPLLRSEVEDAATVGSYPSLDRFNRVTNSAWTKVLSTPRDFYNVQIGYDRSSNITWTTDKIHLGGVAGNHRFDVAYTLDGLHRLTKAEEGEVSGGAYSSNRRVVEEWGLSQTGNFTTNQLSLDGNTTYTDTGDIDDARNHNTVNEITQWRPDGSTNLTPAYDAPGNMTDDGRDYEFKYDALGRLKSVTQTAGTKKLVTEYRYNGLGYRIGWHYDADADGTVESTSDDPWVYQTFDERWRVVATYIADQSTPKEQFYHHAAGLDGYGGSSYIDSVILRDRDMTDAGGKVPFTGKGDGTLEERVYYCQNWRADVSALVDYTSGACLQLEHDKYLSYGTPWGLPAGDLDSDGDYDVNDEKDIDALILATGYDVRADADLDGAVTAYDKADLSGSKITLGRGLMSDSGTFNRRGYAGYDNDGVLSDGANAKSNTRFWHVRHRVLDSTMGRWTRRVPAGYQDDYSLLQYITASPLSGVDTLGLRRQGTRSCAGLPCSFSTRTCSTSGCVVTAVWPPSCIGAPTPPAITICNVLVPPPPAIPCPRGCACTGSLRSVFRLITRTATPLRFSAGGCQFVGVCATVVVGDTTVVGTCQPVAIPSPGGPVGPSPPGPTGPSNLGSQTSRKSDGGTSVSTCSQLGGCG